MKSPDPSLIVAVDGGGSTCRAAIATFDNEILSRTVGPPANVTTDFDQSRQNVLETIALAYQQAGLDPDRMARDVAFLGLAGADVADFAATLANSLGFSAARVTSDRDITVQGALGDEDGVVALLGTGSFFVRRHGGNTRNIGGWGLQIGDDFSAAFLGRELLRKTLWAHDGLALQSDLTQAVMEQFSRDPSNMVTFAKSASPMEFGKLAPMLTRAFDNGDPMAEAILSPAINGVAGILENLVAHDSEKICFLGGMGPFYQKHMPEALRNLCQPPRGDGLTGAVQLARKEFGGVSA